MKDTDEQIIDVEVEAMTGYHLAIAISLELKARFGDEFAKSLIRRMTAQREDVIEDQMLGDAALLDAGITHVAKIICPTS